MKKLLVLVLMVSLLPMMTVAKKSKMDPKLQEKIKELIQPVGVILIDGIPTMTEKGTDSEGSDVNIRIVIHDGGEWKWGKRLFGLKKSMGSTNVFNKGDLITLAASPYFRRGALYFEVRSKDTKEVTRGKSIYEKKYNEYHRTLFQFKFSNQYTTDTEENFEFIKEAIVKYIKFFKTESDAMLFVDSEVGSTTEIKVGMTIEEVVKILGVPKQKAKSGNKVKYKYEDWKITFVDGKVVEVDF